MDACFPHLLLASHAGAMQLTRALALALLLAVAGGAAGLPLLDPSEVVGGLSASGQGVEGPLAKWHKPDFCG